MLADAIGTVAGALTTVAFLPQVVKTWRSRSAGDISLSMFLAFCTGVALWLIYAVLVRAWPIILANAVTLCLAGLILAMKIRHVMDGKGRRLQKRRP